MPSIVIMGAGRMGTLIRSTAEATRDATGAPEFTVLAQAGSDPQALADAPVADAIVDFSHESALPAVAAYVRRTGSALVSGTTGYSDEQMAELRALGEVAPVMHSGNYSLGVAALRHLVAQAARELPGFDVEIVECHHNQKADAPSGTAKLLFDAINEAEGGTLTPVHGREGACGARTPREVGIHAVRGGTVAGAHTVSFFGLDEELSLTHRATSRQIFATGAIAAVRAIVGKQPGFYTFDELMFG